VEKSENPHLKLAKMGAETWNRWARTLMDDEAIDALGMPDEKKQELKEIKPLNYEEQNKLAEKLGLSDLDELDMDANFGGVEIEFEFNAFWFPGKAGFIEAIFSGYADFGKAIFSGYADFGKAIFSGQADFREATFSEHAYFSKATFSSHAYFPEATFSRYAYFIKATFSGPADFREATFSSRAYFPEATFSEAAYFSEATFSGAADFNKATFSRYADFSKAIFSGFADFREATFSWGAHFINASFESTTYFKYTEFNKPPEFHNVDLHQNTSFYGVKYKNETGNEDEARAWRTLKLAMNKIHNHDQELIFFKYEMDAKREVLKAGDQYVSWFLIGLYGTVSDYGTSIFKPFFGLASSWFLFALLYSFCSCDDGSLSLTILVEDYCFKGFQLSTANLLPFVPSSKAAVSAVFSGGDSMGFAIQLMTVDFFSAAIFDWLGLKA